MSDDARRFNPSEVNHVINLELQLADHDGVLVCRVWDGEEAPVYLAVEVVDDESITDLLGMVGWLNLTSDNMTLFPKVNKITRGSTANQAISRALFGDLLGG